MNMHSGNNAGADIEQLLIPDHSCPKITCYGAKNKYAESLHFNFKHT